MGRAHVAAVDTSMQLADHVRELRTRLMIIAALFLAASCLAYYFREPLLNLLLSPLEGRKLVYLNPAGGFNFIFLVSIYVGMAAAAPIFVWQLYCFLRPVLPPRVQRYSGRLLLGSMLLLIAGVLFGYFMAIPGALHFLYSFADEYVTASLTADSYLNFIVAYTLGLGVVFQLPLLLLIFHWIRPLKPGGLLKSERWIIVGAFIAAAIITPTPDPLNQTIIALPIVAVYQIGVFLVLLSIRKQRKLVKQAAKRAKRQAALAAKEAERHAKQAAKHARRRPIADLQPAPIMAARVATRPTVAKPAVRPAPKRHATRSMDGMMVSHRQTVMKRTPAPRPQAIAKPKPVSATLPTMQGRQPRFVDGISPQIRPASTEL